MGGLKGVEAENVKEVEKLILDSLEKIAEEGFSESNGSRFKHTGIPNNSKGISFMFSTMAKWIYDEKPSAATEFNNPLRILKDVVKKSHSAIFQVLLKRYLFRTVIELQLK